MIKHKFSVNWEVNWDISLESIEESIFEQLIAFIAMEYQNGNYPDQFMMPSIRNLTLFLGVKRHLVERAYSYWIKRNEILYARGRRGTFMYDPSIAFQTVDVASRAQFSSKQKPAILSKEHKLMNILTLGSTYPVQSVNVLDFREKNRAGKSAIATDKPAFWDLKDDLRVLRSRNLINNTRQFCIVPDGRAVTEILETMTSPEDLLVIASQNDTTLIETAVQLRLNVAFSGSDDQGMSAKVLEGICQQERVKVVFVRPEPDFPIPYRMDEARWNQIVRLSERFKFCIIVCDDDYEFHCTKSPRLPLSLSGGNVIYIASYSKVYPILHKTSMVAGPEDFIATLRKNVEKLVVCWNLSTEKALMASLSRSELMFQLRKSNQSCLHGAYSLNLLHESYLLNFAWLILPGCGTFGFLKFKSPLSGLPPATFLEHKLYHEVENFAFDPDEPIDGFRISLFISDWAPLEFSLKMIREMLEEKQRNDRGKCSGRVVHSNGVQQGSS